MSDGNDVNSFELTFDEKRNVMYAVHCGQYTLPLLKKYTDAIVNHPRWRPGMSLLADFRRADASQLSSEDVQTYVQYSRQFSEKMVGTRVATVADKPLNFGMIRVWEAYASIEGSVLEYRLFKTVEEAEAWLVVSAMAKARPSRVK